jgi:hypothetical protein
VSYRMDENYLYSVKEAAKALYVCKATLERAIKQAPLPFIDLNRGIQRFPLIKIEGSALIEFVTNRRIATERKELHEVKNRKVTFFRGL